MVSNLTPCPAPAVGRPRGGDIARSIAALIDGVYLHAALGAETPNAARATARVEAYLTLELKGA